MALAPAEGRAEADSLWSSDFSPRLALSDCGRWTLDPSGFCVADDRRNGLEVGVRFQTSRPVRITGVRIYRVESATVRASLWEADGTLLTRGTFAAFDGPGWRDMSFEEPVTIVPGRTYLASYLTPGTKYAFQHYFFRDTGRTVGPITALRSVEGEPNGVHCYADAACGEFPVRPYRDSSYFVSPLWSAPGDAGADPTTGTPTTAPTDPAADPPNGPPNGPRGKGAGADITGPRATSFVPAPKRRVRTTTNATVTFSEPVRPDSLAGSTIRLRSKGSAEPTRVDLRYDARRSRVVIDPKSPLRARTTYRVLVTSGVRDSSGNRLDQDRTRIGLQGASMTFRTR